MELLGKKIEIWIPRNNDNNSSQDILSKIYSFILGSNLTPLTSDFNSRLSKINYDFIEGAASSGAVCYFGSIIMSLLQIGYIMKLNIMMVHLGS